MKKNIDIEKLNFGIYPHWMKEKLKVEKFNVNGENIIKIEIDRINTGYVSGGPNLKDLDLTDCIGIELDSKVEGTSVCDIFIHATEKDGSRWQSVIFLGNEWAKFKLYSDDFSKMTGDSKNFSFENLISISFGSTLLYVKHHIYFKNFYFIFIDKEKIINEIRKMYEEGVSLAKSSEDRELKNKINEFKLVIENVNFTKNSEELISIFKKINDFLWEIKLYLLVEENIKNYEERKKHGKFSFFW